jgi:alpha-L-rhamnosidase
MDSNPSRRNFLKKTSLSSLSLLWTSPVPSNQATDTPPASTAATVNPVDGKEDSFIMAEKALDLSPARWIWYPMERCLANTMVMFRREIVLPNKPSRAIGHILGDSRYIFFVNGQRVQFGPAPADPRFAEADPIDLTPYLKTGRNVLGIQVLYYGHGEGTWPMGKPGLISKLEIEFGDGPSQLIVTDSNWRTHIARSWRPGQYKRSFLRAFQEECDARLYPKNWNDTNFIPFEEWMPVLELEGEANKPAINLKFNDYANDLNESEHFSQLRERSVPLLQEIKVPVFQLVESASVRWFRPPIEYFESLTKGAFQVIKLPLTNEKTAQSWTVNLDGERGALLTFEFVEQLVGFPFFTIDAPSGTTIELMVQESHQVGGTPLLNTKFNSWTRFICRTGINRFETFDYESFKWVQMHIHGATGNVVISNVGARRRQYPWTNQPNVRCSDSKIQKVIDACINTINNSAQETIVDGMARERQQYSGDASHQLHAIQTAFGDTKLHARFINTFSQGITQEGYFLDCWPAFDRLERLVQRQLNLTKWGPLLDHGVGFNFDCWNYHLYTGDKTELMEVFPRLVRFFNYLLTIRQPNGLFPVENIGIPSVWIDHSAYKQQRHKQCAFNLYVVAMFKKAFSNLCELFDEPELARKARAIAAETHVAVIRNFWSIGQGMFVNNLPWIVEEKELRFCDRSLATAILYELCPDGLVQNSVKMIENPTPNVGISYPANSNWRYWALAKAGSIQTVIDDFRTKWHDIESVASNNTIAEWWHVKPDNAEQWSHCAVSPLFVTYMNIAGIQPLTPGFKKIQIRPQLGDIGQLSLTYHTVLGPILFRSRGKIGNRIINIKLPDGCQAELVLSDKEPMGTAALVSAQSVSGPSVNKITKIDPKTKKALVGVAASSSFSPDAGTKRYRLEGGKEYQFVFKMT